MFCKKCGSQLPDDAKFCKKCGTKLVNESEIKTEPDNDKTSEQSAAKTEPQVNKNADNDKKISAPEPKKKKKKGKGCLTFILKLFFVLVLIVLVLFGLTYLGVFTDSSGNKAPIVTNEPNEEKEPILEEKEDETLWEYEYVPIERTDAAEYYENNSDIVSTVEADKSDRVQTEYDVAENIEQRGFEDYPIMTEYTIDGEYSNEYEIAETSDKHPVYTTYYMTEKKELWTITVINDSITAYPVSFNMQSELDAELIFSEKETITSYDSATNMFYETIPHKDVLIVKVVEHIDAETLDSLTVEVINGYDENME